MENQPATLIDNIVIGEPLVPLRKLGVGKRENTVFLDPEEVTGPDGEIFLPAVLKHVGMYNSTSQIKQINQQRMKQEKFANDPDQNLWRKLKRPEFTNFKIGKHNFWLIVGEPK